MPGPGAPSPCSQHAWQPCWLLSVAFCPRSLGRYKLRAGHYPMVHRREHTVPSALRFHIFLHFVSSACSLRKT